MDIQCKECGEVLAQTPGKRERNFCDSTCRSNFWQKEKRKKVVEKAKKQAKRAAQKKTANTTEKTKEVNSGAENKPKDESKHPLWKEGDPKEGSMAFYMKYECYTYSELKNKLK